MKPPPEEAIYNATQICRKSLSDCIQSDELMQNEWAENRLADFNLWASGLGASVQGRASLDARLASRPDAQDAVANLLQVLTDAVEHCKALGKRTITQMRLLLTTDKFEALLRAALRPVAMRVILELLSLTQKALHAPFHPGPMTLSRAPIWNPP